uniref:Uncharacterized protein n=1 Tax=Anguilla anguilla TaxID=7936 RepID=A0A0E9SUI9_ANGAN
MHSVITPLALYHSSYCPRPKNVICQSRPVWDRDLWKTSASGGNLVHPFSFVIAIKQDCRSINPGLEFCIQIKLRPLQHTII